MNHVSEEEVRGLITGRVEIREAARIIRHLLSDCEACGDRIAAYAGLLFPDAAAEPDAAEPAGTIYDGLVEQATGAALRGEPFWQQQRQELERLLASAQASGGGPDDLWKDLEEDEGTGWPAVEALLQLSAEARFRDRREMLYFALGAQAAATQLDPALYGKALVADLQARVLGELGNAHRLNDNFPAAESAFARAFDLAEAGSGDVLIVARLGDLDASLRMSQRRLSDALERLDLVHRAYLEIGEVHLAGRALVSKGIATYHDGRPREAVELYRQGLTLLDEKREPRIVQMALHDLMAALVDCGEYREAGRMLLKSGLRHAFASDPVNLLRLRWLEGKIFAGRGRLAQAERAFREVRRGFLARDEEYDAALVALELAGVWLEQGKAAAVEELAEEIHEIFWDLGVHREARTAVGYLREACRRQEASPGLVRKIIAFLRRLEWQPQIQFAPSVL